MTKSKRISGSPLGRRVQIGDGGSYLESVAQALRTQLGGSVRFTPDAGTNTHVLTDRRGTFAENKFGAIPVVPLSDPRTTLTTFWLALSVRVGGFGRATYIDHVSIQVFEGDAADSTKALRFRAEWHL